MDLTVSLPVPDLPNTKKGCVNHDDFCINRLDRLHNDWKKLEKNSDTPPSLFEHKPFRRAACTCNKGNEDKDDFGNGDT